MSNESLYAAMTAAINGKLAPEYGVEFTLLETPAQGQFLWRYVNANGVFNAGTFAYVSATVAPSEDRVLAQLSPGGGFVNAYVQVLAPIYYRLGSADRAAVSEALASAESSALAMVMSYEEAFGDITPAGLQEARTRCGEFAVQTPQDFVLAYVAGYLWSGRHATGGPPLTYAQMAAASTLDALRAMLPATPKKGRRVVAEAWRYVHAIGGVVAIESRAQLGSWILARLIDNAGTPGAASGGMRTVDPVTGAVSDTWQVGYVIPTPVRDIAAALADPSRVLQIAIDLPPFRGTRFVQARVEGAGPVRVDTTGFARFLHDSGRDVDLLALASEPLRITITYTGYTRVPIAPAAFEAATGAGWYLPSPIAEAVANRHRDTTGFAFALEPPFNLAPFADGGNFNLLTSLLISNTATATFEYEGGVAEAELAGLRGGGVLVLFEPAGLITRAVCAPGRSRLTFAADATFPVPLLQQSAFAIGCTLSGPASGPQSITDRTRKGESHAELSTEPRQ